MRSCTNYNHLWVLNRSTDSIAYTYQSENIVLKDIKCTDYNVIHEELYL